jgi:CO/xanthine dehydrogenase FAD-binding subunit
MRTDIFVPRDEGELLRFLEHEGSRCTIASGATDLLPRITRNQEQPTLIVDISRVKELRYLKRENGLIRIGALTTIEDLSRSVVLESRYEALKRLRLVFGSPPVRNLATVGGNVAAASSSEDLIPILLVLEADVTLKSLVSERALPLGEFILGKRETSRKENELLSEVSFKEMDGSFWCTFEKIGRRERLIIALVSLACVLKLDPRSDEIEEVRIALNRVHGKVPERASNTERLLKGKVLDAELLRHAVSTLESELSLTSDFRASSSYRIRIAKSFLASALTHCRRCIEAGGVGLGA